LRVDDAELSDFEAIWRVVETVDVRLGGMETVFEDGDTHVGEE